MMSSAGDGGDDDTRSGGAAHTGQKGCDRVLGVSQPPRLRVTGGRAASRQRTESFRRPTVVGRLLEYAHERDQPRLRERLVVWKLHRQDRRGRGRAFTGVFRPAARRSPRRCRTRRRRPVSYTPGSGPTSYVLTRGHCRRTGAGCDRRQGGARLTFRPRCRVCRGC